MGGEFDFRLEIELVWSGLQEYTCLFIFRGLLQSKEFDQKKKTIPPLRANDTQRERHITRF